MVSFQRVFDVERVERFQKNFKFFPHVSTLLNPFLRQSVLMSINVQNINDLNSTSLSSATFIRE